jgi:hypothetical protein
MRLLAVIVVAGLAVSAVAAQADTPSNPAPAATSAADPILAYYPPAALAAHIGGSAVLNCGRSAQDQMIDCRLVSEKPEGQGFGAAALALAERSKVVVGLDLPPSHRGRRQEIFRFRPGPASIDPDVLTSPWLPQPPELASWPTGSQIEQAADRYAGKGAGARAEMLCRADSAGHLDPCVVIAETPKDYGYGKAALALAPLLRLRPITSEGIPIAGAQIDVQIPFSGAGLGFQ